jgi:hypothetical protein
VTVRIKDFPSKSEIAKRLCILGTSRSFCNAH